MKIVKSGKLVAHRKKDYTIELMDIPINTQIIQSYSLIEINEDEYMELYKCSDSWYRHTDKPNIIWTSCKPRTKMYNTFMRLATSKSSGIAYEDLGKKFITDIPGTSRLVRSSDKSRIYIAYRKGNKTLNQTRINSVCIDNIRREEFFDDVKSKHGYLPFIGRYELYAGDYAFDKWNRYMDELYLWEKRRNEK